MQNKQKKPRAMSMPAKLKSNEQTAYNSSLYRFWDVRDMGPLPKTLKRFASESRLCSEESNNPHAPALLEMQ